MDPKSKDIIRDGLTAKQLEFAIWYAQSGTINRACQLMKQDVREARRWLTEPDFVAEYRRVCEVQCQLARSRLQSGVDIAADFVLETVQNTEEPTETRLKAAKMIFDIVVAGPEDAKAAQEKAANPPLDYVRRPSDTKQPVTN